MSDTNPDLERLADKIGELKPLDWDHATRDSGLEPDTALTENLHILSQIASFEAAESLDDGPRFWGPFEILDRISLDEEGERWSARSESGHELEVLLLPSHHSDPGHARADLISAARAMVGAQHPNLVEVMGADAFEGRMGIWMQASQANTLEESCKADEALAADLLLPLGIQLSMAVEAVHARGRFVHAMPPSGVLMDREGHAVLRRLPQLRSATELRPDEKLPSLSAYHFAAPEILGGAAPTQASDAFAIAALLAWAAGEDRGLASIDGINDLQSYRGKSRELRTLPQPLAELLQECLHQEVSRRPASPELFLEHWRAATAQLDANSWPAPPATSFWRRVRQRFQGS